MIDLDVLVEDINKPVYEDDYVVVKEVLFDIPTQSPNWVKRVQIVNWKMKGSSKDELDIRRFSIRENKYQKGISMTVRELKFLLDNIIKLQKFSEIVEEE
jgi:hypothetical protein